MIVADGRMTHVTAVKNINVCIHLGDCEQFILDNLWEKESDTVVKANDTTISKRQQPALLTD